MLRQIMDDYAAEYGIRGRITGLRYLNPGNAPDAWEKQQLEIMTRSEKTEVWEISDMDGKPHLRHLRAMMMTKGCDKCHAILGYKEGDMRGATGVNLPLEPFLKKYHAAAFTHSLGYGIIWIVGLLGIAWGRRSILQRDALQTERIEESQRASMRYRALFDLATDGVLLIDLQDGSIIEFNDIACQQLGYIAEEFSRLKINDFEAMESPDETRQRIQRLLSTGHDKFETKHRHNDGSVRDVLVLARLVQLENKTVAHCTFRDITLQKSKDAELSQYRASLEQKVDERTRELAQRNVQITEALAQLQMVQKQLVQQEKLSGLGALVAGVAHELNTPIGNALTVATSMTEQAKEFEQHRASGAPLRKSELDEFVHHSSQGTVLLERNLNRAAELIQSFKQVAVDRTSSQRRQFDLRETIEDVVATVRPKLKHTAIELHTDVPEKVIMDSYPGALGQVVINLIDNALLHGLGDRDHGRIDLHITISATRITLNITDDGCGIPAEHLGKIFDPFFTTKMGQGGSGLGLHIVHNLVSQILGGTVQVTSTLNQGTEFKVIIPQQAPLSEPSAG